MINKSEEDRIESVHTYFLHITFKCAVLYVMNGRRRSVWESLVVGLDGMGCIMYVCYV
jgi:hypothetical protein